MRNLAKYPPNADEAMQTLIRIKQGIIKNLNPGDLSALYLDRVIEFINTDQDKFQSFLEQKESK